VKITLDAGEEWPYHFRGTRYSYNTKNEVWWRSVKDGPSTLAKKGYERVLKELLPYKTEGGSFRITETGDVIAKVLKDDVWKPIYICEMDEAFGFADDLDITPETIDPGDLWTGFYDGARYSYLNNKVWWNNPDGPRQYADRPLPDEVIKVLRKFKPEGGSFRITENGYVIALIAKQPLPNNLKEQWNRLSEAQRRFIAIKVQSTDMLPVYIGRYHEGITLRPPQDMRKELSSEERDSMLAYLDCFSLNTKFDGMVPRIADSKALGKEFKDDPEDWA